MKNDSERFVELLEKYVKGSSLSDFQEDMILEAAQHIRKLDARKQELEKVVDAAKRGFAEITKRHDYWKAAALEAEDAIPNRGILRHLVDIVWNECTESKEVPSTDWADRMIEEALDGTKFGEMLSAIEVSKR